MVCMSHVLWDLSLWQRNHHVMSRFSESFPVVYCTPLSVMDTAKNPQAEQSVGMERITEHLTLLVPLLIPGEYRSKLIQRLDQWILKNLVGKALRDMGVTEGKKILWFYYPKWVYMVGELEETLVVYDIQDEYLTQFNAPFNIQALEKDLLKSSDIIFTGTNSLAKKKGSGRENIEFIPCGVDYEHFHAASKDTLSLAGEMEDIRKPVLGYIGWIGERVDLDLIYYLAGQKPEWSMVLIGPVDVETNHHPRNVHFLGKKKYQDLPSYLKGFDVCLIPFKMDEVTMDLNPTKLLEYLATRKPVVSVGLNDVRDLYTGTVEIADNREEFLDLADKALKNRSHEQIDRGCELARTMSWDHTVSRMLARITPMLNRRVVNHVETVRIGENR